MKTSFIDKTEVKQAIEQGNNCSGQYWLVVSEDGQSTVKWAETNRQWDPWQESDQAFSLPSLDPDGSGRASEDAWWLAENASEVEESKTEIEEILEEEDWSIIEFLESRYPDEWQTNREEGVDWLAENFLQALNEEPNDLKTGPFYGPDLYARERRFSFEWEESK